MALVQAAKRDFTGADEGDFAVVLITGTIRLPPHHLDAAKAAMAAMIAASRAEAGCLSYSYAADVLEPGLIRVNELWTDASALAAHVQSPHIAAWRATWPSLGITDRDLRRYDVINEQPC